VHARRVRRPVVELPTISPVRPVRRSDPFDDPDFLFEPKYDGFRALAYLTRDACVLRSRNDNHLAQFDDLATAIRAEVQVPDAIFDGEIVSLDQRGQPAFMDLMRHRGWQAYAVFDVLWLNGRDLRALPLARRKRLLELAIPANTASVLKVLSIDGDGLALFRAVEKLDLEGLVAKRSADPYDAATIWYQVPNPGYSQTEGRAELFDRVAQPS